MGFALATPFGALLQLSGIGRGSFQHIVLVCAALSLASSVATAVFVASRRRREPDLPARQSPLVAFGRLAALLLGVAPAIAQSIVLTMRLVYVSIELMRGYPVPQAPEFGYGVGGLWSLGLLVASSAVSLVSTRDVRLAVCLLWTGVMTALWAFLLMPSFAITVTGGFERTTITLWILLSLSGLVATTAVLSGWLESRRFRQTASESPDARMKPVPLHPGLAVSCSVLAMAIGLLVCYHLLIPIRTGGGGYRASSFIATGSAVLTAYACFLLLRRKFSGGLADAGVGLTTLGLCGASTLFVPSHVMVLAERYPMVFNAMIVGFACATALWTWLTEVWRQQLDCGEARTMTERLIPHAKRFAFLSAAMALVAGILMTFWPRLPGIATMDHSYGRVTAGFAANLFLLLVMLWCSRRLRRMTFHLLTLLTVLSTAGFLVMRMIPFASRLG